MKPVKLLLLLVALLALPQHAQAQSAVPRYVPGPCSAEVPSGVDVDCGTLEVPADYDYPDGERLQLAVAIIHSKNANPAPDPIFYTEGGPGYSTMASLGFLARTSLIDNRDLVLLEQRGNLQSEPALTCDVSTWRTESAGNTACLDSLRDRGIDPRQYTTAAIAADLDSLRQLLPYDQWNLYGSSYSTRLMQLTMRTRPEDIRAVVLQGTSSVTDTRHAHDPEHPVRALEKLFADCAADPDCSAAYPDLESQFYELYHRLNADPVSFELRDVRPGETLVEKVDGRRLLGWMVEDSFYGPAFPPYATAYLPLLISQVRQGRADLLEPWLIQEYRNWPSAPFAWGLYFAANCQDDAWQVTDAQIEAQAAAYPELEGYVRYQRELEICRAWDLPPAPPLADGPLQSDVPALIMVGAYDPVTPPMWSQALAADLPNSHYLEFPAAGHSITRGYPCVYRVINDFLDDPGRQPATDCLHDLPDPAFAMPGDVLFVPNLYEYYFGYIGRNLAEHTWYLRLENYLLITVTAALLLWLILAIVRRVRGGGQEQPADMLSRFGRPIVVVIAIAVYIYSQLMRGLVRDLAADQGALLRFGAPADSWPLFALGLLLALCVVGTLILLLLAWRRRAWTLAERIVATLAAIPPAGLIFMFANWGWLTVLLR